jgi:hypothetical protein
VRGVLLRGCELLHVGDLGFVVYGVDLWFCSCSVMRLFTFHDERTACLLDIRAANRHLEAERPIAQALAVDLVETAIGDFDVGFHMMMLDLAVVGEVEDPVMVFQVRLNMKALVAVEVELMRRTGGMFESDEARSMP